MRQGGFTLVELMVVLAVLAISISVVIPAMQNIYLKETGTAQSLDFVASLNYARSEAIKRGTQTILCKGATCDNNLNWQDGWLVFADINNNSIFDDPDVTLRVHGPLTDPAATLDGNDGVNNTVTFNANGTSQNGSFLLCDSRGIGEHAKAIVLRSGRIRVIPQNDPSAPDTVRDATSCQF